MKKLFINIEENNKNITIGLLVSEGDHAHTANETQASESGRIRLKSVI